ncbi:MAG: alpha/beta fold hydrolase [Actinomycetota bacterium]
MRREEIRFVGAAGAELAGLIQRPPPDAEVVGSALIAHCFTCGKDLHTTARLAKALTRAGWLTMTFDFTGVGESGGDFGDTTIGTDIGDITRAAVALIERNAGPCVLIGHSLGGAAAVLAASRLKTVDRVVAIASPADTTHVEHLFADAPVIDGGSVCATIGGRTFRLGPDFLAGLGSHDVVSAASAFEGPFLVVQAGADTVVGAEQTSRLAHAGGAELAIVDGADHLFTGREASTALADVVVGWLART